MFTLVFRHGFLGREWDLVLVVTLISTLLQLMVPHLWLKRGSFKQLHYRVTLSQWEPPTFCQDTWNGVYVNNCDRGCMGWGWNSASPAHLEKSRNGILGQDCLLRENFGWWLSPFEPWTLNPVSVHGCCSNQHSEVKWTMEYKMPESSSLDPLICGSPVCYFFPKWNCQSHGLSALPAWCKEEVVTLVRHSIWETFLLRKAKEIRKTCQYSPNPHKLQSAPGSYIQCMNKCYSPILIHCENILQINTMTTSKHLCFAWFGHLIQDGMNMPLVLFCFIFSSF